MREFNNRCVRCGVSGVTITKDHIVMVCSGGSDSIDNIQPLCSFCNSSSYGEFYNWKEHRRKHGWDFIVPRVNTLGKSVDNPDLYADWFYFKLKLTTGKVVEKSVRAFSREGAEWLARKRTWKDGEIRPLEVIVLSVDEDKNSQEMLYNSLKEILNSLPNERAWLSNEAERKALDAIRYYEELEYNERMARAREAKAALKKKHAKIFEKE